MALLPSNKPTSAAEFRFTDDALSSGVRRDVIVPITVHGGIVDLPERPSDMSAVEHKWVEMRFTTGIDYAREEIEYGDFAVRVWPTTKRF